jgi:hypothetical protein
MKQFLLFTILLTGIFNSYSQKIHFCDTNNRWGYSGQHPEGCYYNYVNTLGPDTMIDGQHYFRMNLDCAYVPCYGGMIGDCAVTENYHYVREDTITNKIYAINFIYGETVEHLLYDFNLNVGDTFHINYMGLSEFRTDTVIKIDSIIIFGAYHKVFTLLWRSLPAEHVLYTVIEGIGCTQSMFRPEVSVCFEGAKWMTCFSRSGVYPPFTVLRNACFAPYDTNLVNSTNCNQAIATYPPHLNSVTLNDNQTITASPNPCFDHLNLTSSSNWHQGTTARIYDLTGKILFNLLPSPLEKTLSIDVRLLNNGLYFMEVISENGLIYRQKVVVNR